MVMGGDSIQKVVGWNPSTAYWMDIFSQIFVAKFVMFVRKGKNKLKKGPGMVHF